MNRRLCALGLALLGAWGSAHSAPGADDAKTRPEPPVEVYDWSVWVGSPAQPALNGARVYRNALPRAVGTSRPDAEGAELDRKFPVAPVSVVQVFGDPTDDLDVDLRVKKGSLLAHWPPAGDRTGGVRWFKSNWSKAVPAGFAPGNLAEDHWLQRLRRVDAALYGKYEARVERFLTYDAEVAAPLPIKIRGGPDEYTLQNLTAFKLLDVAVIAPAEGGGYRVGWLDSLPTAVPKESAADEQAKAKTKEDEKRQEAARPDAKERAAKAVLDAAEEEDKAREKERAEAKAAEAKKAEPKPIPPEADADLRARVDQALNRAVNIDVPQASRKDMLALIATQARLRTDVDDPTLLKEKVDLNEPVKLRVGSSAARDALAEVLGSVGLSYRITDDASLFITTAARLAAEGGKNRVIEGPPVKLTLGPPLKPSDPSYRKATLDDHARRLAAQGLRPEVVRTILDQYGATLFEPGKLVVLAHLSRDAIDEAVLLDVFPAPKKFVRVALVVAHGVDPRLQDEARTLVRKLGDASPPAREAAESALFDLGPVALPVLEDALRDHDIEVVYRAERVLMRLNRPVPGN